MFKNVKDQVEYVLKTYPQTRNSDKLLVVKILNKFYGVHELEDIMSPTVPPLETIRRHRQKFQEKGLYQSDKQIMKAREQRQAAFLGIAFER